MLRISRNAIAIGYLLALAILAIDGLLVASSLGTILQGNTRVDRGREAISQLDLVLALLKDAETGQRGYLLTGREAYLDPFRSAEAGLPAALGALRLLVEEDDLRRRVEQLAVSAFEKMAELRQTVRLRQAGRSDEALRIVETDQGRLVMDRIRSIVAEIRTGEEQILGSRQAASRSAVRRTLVTFGLTTGLALLLLAGSSYFQRQEARALERSAEAVRSSEAWLATTLSSIGDAVIATDELGRVKFLNPVAQELTGWNQAEAVGRSMAEVFPIINESTRLPVENPVARVLAEGRVVGLANHTLLIRKNGHETPIDDSAAPIKDRKGEVAGVVLVFRDITERKRQGVEVEEQRRLAEFGRDMGLALTETPNLAMLARRCAEETVRHLDGAFARIWALDQAGEVLELLASAGLYTHIDGPHARVPVGMYKIGKIASDRQPHLTNEVIGDPRVPAQEWAKTEGMVAFAGYPLIVEDRVVGVWAMFARHPLSEATLRAMESVARGIAVGIERCRVEEARRVAQEQAEQANRAKTQFLAVLSHELRTPLNPILLAVTAMLERPTSADDIQVNLEMIRQNVNLQSRLIDDLLDVMRIVRGKMALHWEVVDAHALIDHSVGICRSEVFGKELGLKVELAAPHHHINADPVRLQQVFWNLIKNAVKFTPKGGSITIRTRNVVENGDPREERLLIEVSDDGIGIEPEVVGRIFDPFQQGETSINRRFGGLGLGLAISKGIVEGHGGVLKVESRGRGLGTTFRLELRALPDPKPGENGHPAPIPPVAEPASTSRLKILLVEDEQATRRLMARLLSDLGHEVTTAGTIAEALSEESSGDFGLIVSDIGLPDGSGLELMRQVVARRGAIPAIALTGYGMEEDIQRSRAAGFTAHMTKPIDFTKLEAMIRQVGS